MQGYLRRKKLTTWPVTVKVVQQEAKGGKRGGKRVEVLLGFCFPRRREAKDDRDGVASARILSQEKIPFCLRTVSTQNEWKNVMAMTVSEMLQDGSVSTGVVLGDTLASRPR